MPGDGGERPPPAPPRPAARGAAAAARPREGGGGRYRENCGATGLGPRRAGAGGEAGGAAVSRGLVAAGGEAERAERAARPEGGGGRWRAGPASATVPVSEPVGCVPQGRRCRPGTGRGADL